MASLHQFSRPESAGAIQPTTDKAASPTSSTTDKSPSPILQAPITTELPSFSRGDASSYVLISCAFESILSAIPLIVEANDSNTVS